MRTKSICDLAECDDTQMFAAVSTGLQHIVNSCTALWQDSVLLAKPERARGSNILLRMAAEEAAKYLILLDAIRCPRQKQEPLRRQLGCFNNHLAKSIYAYLCELSPATFGEVHCIVERERQELYLDGPHDVDWVFRNELLEQREREMYVDYARTEEGHEWLTPPGNDPENGLQLEFGDVCPVLRLVHALHSSGFSSAGALKVVARVWRPVDMTTAYHFQELRGLNYHTLEELRSGALLAEQPDEVYRIIVDAWLFPLYSIELQVARVNRAHLESRREHRLVDFSS